MERVLAALTPLTALLETTADPFAALERLIDRAGSGGPALIAALAHDTGEREGGGFAADVLGTAGVLGPDGAETPQARLRLAQVQALLECRQATTTCELVITVPPYLRNAVTRHPRLRRVRETGAAVRAVAANAHHRLAIAAPYLHAGFVETLVPAASRVVGAGGLVRVVTRAARTAGSGLEATNAAAVATLRARVPAGPGRLEVRSWEEEGLGVHLKAVVADSIIAYVGSANPTWGGTEAHAEAGLLLSGPKAADLDAWIDAIAEELGGRRLPHA